MNVKEKITEFFSNAIKLYGKEVGLYSNQIFEINQIIDKTNDKPGKYNYVIQYGFPQSGSVCINFSYSNEQQFIINKVSVFAPSSDKEMQIVNFAPQTEIGEIGISINFGLDVGTIEHSKLSEIENNPNALMMLDIAIDDLRKAKTLGECRAYVPSGSTMIPCTTSTHILNEKAYK